ncbi:MAG: hypothetical protein ACRDRZ_07415 [Pseudonocardiaceae bacterium]
MLTAVGDQPREPVELPEPRPRRWRVPAVSRRDPVTVWNRALIVAGVVVSAVIGWQQRWIADDGLIVLRTVRQVLAGNGPVFNIGERVEVNTSTVWTVMLAVAGSFPGVRLDWAAVGIGLGCTAAGFGLGMDAARRLHRSGAVVLMPLGAIALLALPPVWDFATSGLETGLITLWLATSWWLLVRVARGGRDGPVPWTAAVLLGLGPLVRPDLGVFSVLGLLVLVMVLRPGWRRLLGLGAAAGAMPVGYEVFRAGYYGLLVPSTALAKEASRARWEQGVVYLHDMVATYWLWVPLGCALLALGALLVRRHGGWDDRWATVAVTLFPLVGGLLMALYVVRVGGDFMHGRMLLPAITALLLPVLVVPLTWWTLLPVVGVAVWAPIADTVLRADYGAQVDTRTGIVDERAFWSANTAERHPVSASDYIDAHGAIRRSMPVVQRQDRPAVLLLDAGPRYATWDAYLARDGVDHVTVPYLNLGMMGAAHPVDVRVVDPVGLSNPLAAHATTVFGGRIGHDKDLPTAWYVADEGRRSDVVPVDREPVDREQLRHAREALACPQIRELLESVRAPLTPQRFWDNLTGSVERTGFRFSQLPQRAAEDCRG